MKVSRLFSVAVVFAAGASAAVIACGGSDNKATDAAVHMDAQGSGSGSGSGSDSGSGSNNLTGLGQHCTAMNGSGSGFPQSDCPPGYECMNLTGGHDTWCSKRCAQGSGDMCNQGYTGPGQGACVYSISFTQGGSGVFYCGIVCALNQANACPNCDGTCPGSLTCSATLGSTGSGGSATGSACL
jgi:hypothetical protein